MRVARQAVQRRDRLVPRDHIRPGLPLPDADLRRAQHEVEPLTTLTQRLLGGPPFGDVAKGDDRSGDGAVLHERPGDVLDGEAGAVPAPEHLIVHAALQTVHVSGLLWHLSAG